MVRKYWRAPTPTTAATKSSKHTSIFPQRRHTAYIERVIKRPIRYDDDPAHEGKEYWLRQTVRGIRESFESGELYALQWMESGVNIADTLTKINPYTQRLFKCVLSTGMFTYHRTDHLNFAVRALNERGETVRNPARLPFAVGEF